MSYPDGILEHMFGGQFAEVDDAALVAAIADGARAEAEAAARRFAAIAELIRRKVSEDDERNLCAFDPWDSVAAEVAAAMTIGHRRASGQMRIAQALRERLPQVAALFERGGIGARIVSAITWRTQLVEDPEALALIDTALAKRASRLGPLSEQRLDEAIDALVDKFDPEAVRRSRSTARTRDFHIGDLDDPVGTTSVWGRLLVTDAAVLKSRLAEMMQGLCDNDPRSMGERRADAIGALAANQDRLGCACGSPTCAAAAPQTSNVVLHVIADQDAFENAAATAGNDATPATDGDTHGATPPQADAERAAPPQPDSPGAGKRGTAVLLGHGALPTSLLPWLISRGAKVRPIKMPGPDAEARYQPSTALAEFVRMRDMYCRAPGCDVRADLCDIDHTTPWPLGPTHPSNLKCLCRKHHMMKTFDGWLDVQLPDGTVIWKSPSGRTYTTTPGSKLFFDWDTTTANLPPPPLVSPSQADRTAKIPKRKRTRAADFAARIKAERARNVDPAPF
ncbi:HNH endonuclease signature motif containing protein [Mycolicibacterium novocastrense]|uniref:HNH endonuclease signature motif containing protein n=1 Tax=Mycolicibacterium novocastrense TaxID=59813 RepID=UPI000AE2B800|nr:HNH endonuclease signature motif containing protein [Mycolicibacterium novocastrense]